MFPQIKIIHNVGNVIEIPNQILVKVFTYLSDNVPIGVTSIPADNATEFDSGSILLLLSSMGAENCEFVTGSAHTDLDFTISATRQPHNRGEAIQLVNYDQVILLKSSTLGGSYTPLVTQTFQTTQQNTILFDGVGLSTDYYKVQWKNSITNNVSEMSAPISVLAYPSNSVASVIYPVLKAMGIGENDPKITIPFCLSAIDDARKFVDARFFGIRQDWREVFEFPIQVLAGTNFVPLPDDVDFEFTDRSVLAARFILNNVLAPYNLKYIDKRSWNQLTYQNQGGITTEDLTIGATSIQLNSAGDFAVGSNGVAYVATTERDQELLEIEYDSVDILTNTLVGVTGLDRDVPAGTQVWQIPCLAQPMFYTAFVVSGEEKGKIWFDRVIPDSMQGNNFYVDYYKKLYPVENLYQTLPEPYREIYKWYLRYAIKYRKDITLPSSDADLVKFESLVTALFNNMYTGQQQVVITS